MLLPNKHISVAESLLGFGAVVLSHLDQPKSVDSLYSLVKSDMARGTLPAYHDFDSLMLTVLFLYSIGAVKLTRSGGVKRCAS
jgi:hypothetical protein